MSPTFGAELLKLARSRVAHVATAVLVLAVPLLAVGFAAAAEHGGDSTLALKVRPMVPGHGWDAVTTTTGQVLTVAVLLAGGFVVSWVFGRELAQGTIEPLLTGRPSRAGIASAKLAVVTLWATAASVAAVAVALCLGLVLGTTAGSPWPGAARAVVGGVLAALLALPFGLVATWGRDALAGVGAVLGIVVVTQVVTVVGGGAWFPWAAPGLWLGMGGDGVVVSAWQLATAPLVAVAGWAATTWWWSRAELIGR
ncbi:ABC transporter permease [Cellulosimicrobium arenosum]|uniref:ABC transporter permease n=1 Tax=Cellulosimicrobium arenosum TaxID=2708133 RepID=A0A927PDI0_9MICO|nr:ABC transporter permease [Cellulosimicrobium arenosum]MBD8079713.1 ABC transporter permease [Cellulosimicrobium arenosum]